MKYRTIKKNGKRRVIPISEKQRYSRARRVSSRELQDDLRVGIRHPGSLVDLGYHIKEPVQKQHAALDMAVKKYGKTDTLRKLADLYRLDYHRPELKAGIVSSIKYVTGGKRND